MKYLFIILGLMLLVPGALAADPYAGFIPSSINGSDPLTVRFTDISYNTPTQWNWTMQNMATGGNPVITFSVIQTPTYTFHTGNWSIRLNVSNAMGYNVSPANQVWVNVTGTTYPIANFAITSTPTQIGAIVLFNDTSTGVPTVWQWFIQDTVNTTINTRNASHTWQAAGVYLVTLHVSNAAGDGVYDQYVTVTSGVVHAPVANFTPAGSYNGTLGGYQINTSIGTPMTFTDTSTNTPTSWQWVFQTKNGNVMSSAQNPTMIYDANNATVGSMYNVLMYATNSAGTSSTQKWVMVSSAPVAPIAQYSVYDTTAPAHSLININNGMPTPSISVKTYDNVIFNDTSLNGPTATSFYIDFGNSSAQTFYGVAGLTVNLQYTNARTGTYPVIFTASNDLGSDSVYFPHIIHFTNMLPPASISGLVNSSFSPSSIVWGWNNPAVQSYDTYDHVMIYKDGVFYQNVSAASTSTQWDGLTQNTVYTISTQTVDTDGNVQPSWVNSSAQTGSGTWSYTIPGTYNWVCPVGVYNISVTQISAGGSGLGGWNNGYGSGGSAGQMMSYAIIPVTPGYTYPIVVPAGGIESPGSILTSSPVSYQGGAVSAFGNTLPGGLGGQTYVASNLSSNGSAGYYTSAKLAEDGSMGATGYYGGPAGAGFGAGGGGGGSGASQANKTGGNGGYGADGAVFIAVVGAISQNNPSFTMDVSSGPPGLIVHFTDTSVLVNTTGLAYNWSFGDTLYSSTIGNVVHVYAYAGVFTPTLTITSTNGSVIYTSPTSIIVSSQNAQNTWWTPHTVQITVMDDYGARLPDVQLNATYNQSAMPTAWVSELYGIMAAPGADVVNKTLVLGGTTGSDGTLTTTMLGSLKYDIYLTSAAYGLNNYHVSAYPSDTMLNIYVTTSTGALLINNTNTTYNQMNGTRVYAYEPDINTVDMCINYVDTSGNTQSVNETWLYANNNTIIYNQIITPGTAANLTCISLPNIRGTEVWWGYNSTRGA